MMDITDDGCIKNERGKVLGLITDKTVRGRLFCPASCVLLCAADLEEIVRLMRGDDVGDDEWIEQENFTIDQSKGLVGLRVKTLGGLETTLRCLDSCNERYSHATSENGELLFVNHKSDIKHVRNIVAYRGPKL